MSSIFQTNHNVTKHLKREVDIANKSPKCPKITLQNILRYQKIRGNPASNSVKNVSTPVHKVADHSLKPSPQPLTQKTTALYANYRLLHMCAYINQTPLASLFNGRYSLFFKSDTNNPYLHIKSNCPSHRHTGYSCPT